MSRKYEDRWNAFQGGQNLYLTKFRLENAGPIDFLEEELPVQGDKAPKPLILVGPNGSGKSIFLSHIVSAMMGAHSTVFEDTDVEKGKVYKLRSPLYIRRGKQYSLSCLEFSDGLYVDEVTLICSKKDFEDTHKYTPIFKRWGEVDASLNSSYHTNFTEQVAKVRDALIGPHLYFPPNRFEDPAWLNELNLINTVEYFDAKRVAEISHRPVIQYAPMKDNQSWLLDLIYDSFTVELTHTPVTIPAAQIPLFSVSRDGAATKFLRKIEDFVRLLLGGEGKITWGVGGRSRRTISVSASGNVLTSNLLALSTGQAVLFDLFLTILRHADLSGQQINELSDVRGLVVVDEIDLHLHTTLQFEMLPNLIHMFPGVQFILSSHSPLFLLGMEKAFGEGEVTILDMPTGEYISAERFCEFEAAFEYLSETRRFESDFNKKLSEATQPLLIVEGTTDIDYIRKAAEVLGKEDALAGIEFVDGDGFKGLNKIWNNLHHKRWTNVSQTVVLLYDCDVNPKNNEIGKAYQRTIPKRDSIIEKGIENLFSKTSIDRAREHKPAFIDHYPTTIRTVRGNQIREPEKWLVNKDEKRNLCDWLCENGDTKDFERFSAVFDILEACFEG